MKKVSLIVPVYNVENYLRKCLDSLVNQTFKDIEIIVVNDGTKDNSQKIIDEYCEKYPEIVKSFIKDNGGLSSARNYGVKKSNGEYLGFIDSDDYIDLDYCEKMYNQAKKEDSDVVASQVKYIYRDKISYNNFNKDLYNKSVIENPKMLLELKSYAPNKFYRRKIWLENNFEFPTQYFEDSAVIYNVLLKANKVSCVLDSFYYYNRINETSITKIADNRAYDIFKSCDSILSYYKENNEDDKTKEIVDAVIIGHIRFRIRTYINSFEPKKLKEFIKYSHNYLDEKIPDWRKKYLNIPKYNKNFHNKLYYF